MDQFEETKKLLNNSTIYYLISVDMNSNYAYLNNRYKQAFHGIHGNLVGQHYSKTIHPEDLHICHSVSMQCFRNPDEVFPAIIRKIDGKGGYIFTQWEYKAMFDDNNNPSGVFCIGNDITEFMNTSLTLQETTASLNVAKVTLDEIAYIQSHVVRKPIANILGLSMVLENMDADDAIKSITAMITDSAKELDEVIKSVSKKI